MKYYLCEEIAQAYGLSKATIVNYCKTGKIAGKKYKYDKKNPLKYVWLIPYVELKKIDRPPIREPHPVEYSPDEGDVMLEWVEATLKRISQIVDQREAHRQYENFVQHGKEYYFRWTKTLRYKALRDKRLKHDKYQCQLCGTGKNLIIHHVSYEHLGEASEFDDLVTLCRKCHQEVHRKDLEI